MKSYKKILTTALKIGITVLLLFFVFQKIPFSEVWEIVKKSKIHFLLLALVSFVVSQVISSQRLLGFFHANQFNLNSKDNWKLYLVGMFYNFFIPGGIGGDAYKVYVLNKKFGWSVKKLSSSVLVDRVSGLLAILVLIQILSLFFLKNLFLFLPFVGIFVTVLTAKFILKRFFPTFDSIFIKSLIFSLGVQIFQLVCIFFILKSFSTTEDFWIYGIVFLLSSILSLISFSGIGVREWLFMKASQYFGFNAEVSVSAALIFSFITALVSLVGVYYQSRGLSFQDKTENV